MTPLEQAVMAADVDALARLLEGTPRAGKAREIILGEHFFTSWPEFEALQQAPPDSAVACFESAVEAILDGDESALRELLGQHPALIHQRSIRTHRATLLHYVAANGVENFRQRTPANALAITQMLIDYGAVVDATASMYSENLDTTLGLAATSIHPVNAGVLEPLLDLLLRHGARIDGSLINACHANGRPLAAKLLAARGATLDLEAAAGLGQLDVVRALYSATPAAGVRSGFAWACEYGHTDCVAFFLDQGMDVSTRLRNHGQTGLHWAAAGGHLEIMRLLLARLSPLDAKDEAFGGTPLTWALWGFHNRDPGAPNADSYYEAVKLLVAAGSKVSPAWIAQESDEQMQSALQ